MVPRVCARPQTVVPLLAALTAPEHATVLQQLLELLCQAAAAASAAAEAPRTGAQAAARATPAVLAALGPRLFLVRMVPLLQECLSRDLDARDDSGLAELVALVQRWLIAVAGDADSGAEAGVTGAVAAVLAQAPMACADRSTVKALVRLLAAMPGPDGWGALGAAFHAVLTAAPWPTKVGPRGTKLGVGVLGKIVCLLRLWVRSEGVRMCMRAFTHPLPPSPVGPRRRKNRRGCPLLQIYFVLHKLPADNPHRSELLDTMFPRFIQEVDGMAWPAAECCPDEDNFSWISRRDEHQDLMVGVVPLSVNANACVSVCVCACAPVCSQLCPALAARTPKGSRRL